MTIETELNEIRKQMSEISKKLDSLILDKEAFLLMKLSEISLKKFLDDEPDIYNLDDLKVRYK